MTLIEIQRASSSWKLRRLYVQGPVLTVHNETLWHDQSDGDFSSAIRLGIRRSCVVGKNGDRARAIRFFALYM